jgi:hypothetical protein
MSSENRDEGRDTVSDPENAPTTTQAPDEMRPIPDGGLRQSMPEWLRRPPAWRDLPKKEIAPAPEAEAVAVVAPEKPTLQPEKSLPEPDMSEIDPRSLVDVADLPQWLQDIAARSTVQAVAEPDEEPAPPVMIDNPEPEEEDMTDPEKRLEREPSADRDVAFEPVDKKRWETPEQETKVYGGGKPANGMSQQILIGVIAAALVVIVVLLLMIF